MTSQRPQEGARGEALPGTDPLIAATEDLRAEVKTFNEHLTIVKRLQESQSKALNRARAAVIGVLVIFLAATVAVVVVRQVNCHLYALFTDSLNPDFNKDGKVSVEERQAFDLQIDRNHDGTVTAAERAYFRKVSDGIFADFDRLHC